ncbi:MAG: efflux RND transporter periplasmic adaptor subunit [Gemmatimonadaceae bacterium]
MERRRWIIVGAVGLSVATLATACGDASAGAGRADDAEGAFRSAAVVRRDLLSTVKATGVIRPMVGAEVRVGSRISGVVTRLDVRVGDAVEKGQLLARLDDRDWITRRDEAAAALGRAEIDARFTSADLRRAQELAVAGGVPPSELDAVARAAALAEQQVLSARASVAFADAQVEYTRIVAPIGGVVASVATQEGETVAASFAAPTFLTLLDPRRLELWTYVDETDIGRIRPGQRARFTVDTYAGEEFEGRVATVYPKAEIRDNVVNYIAVVRFESPRGRTLRPEMTATVRVVIDEKEAALTVPIRAVRLEGGRTYVLLARGNETERRWVRAGVRDAQYVEILEGLDERDSVVLGEPNTPEGGKR